MQESRFFLAPDVFFCLSGDYYVFLELREDEYWCLPRMETKNFGAFVSGWPLYPNAGERSRFEERAGIEAELQELVAAGLLTTCSSAGKKAAPVQIQLPESSLHDTDGELSGWKQLGPGDVMGFMTACMRAALQLRWRCIKDIVRTVEDRKVKHVAKIGDTDFQKTAEILSRFDRLRPWYPRTYLCLFDSLALIEFLARNDVFPTWVFGVRTAPFHAHCWVQQGEVVLNEPLDRVRSFTPIMAI